MNKLKIDNLEEILSSPVSEEIALQLLSVDDTRDDFLVEYAYFSCDGNEKLYSQWIAENVSSKSNVIVEHIFRLADYSGMREKVLFAKVKEVLRNKYWQFTKLACLEYLMSQRNAIEYSDFVSLNKLGFIHTKNELVKFQACINLIIHDQQLSENLQRIRNILKKAEYPTLFYRLIYQIDTLPSGSRNKITELLSAELKLKKFDKGVVKEIRVLLNKYIST